MAERLKYRGGRSDDEVLFELVALGDVVAGDLVDDGAVIEEICAQYADAELTAMCSFAPLADVRGMAHEHADRRLFMS